MTNFLRGISLDYARLVQNFDIVSDPTKMVPYRDFTADVFDTGLSATNNKLCKFLSAKTPANDATQQYALGVVSGSTRAKIFQKSTAASGFWIASATAEDSATGMNENLFIEYQGTIWGANTSNLWSYEIASGIFTSAARAITFTGIFQGLVHSKDDILYIPYYNSTAAYIASKNGAGAWNLTALTLPTNMIPISICEFGNYLAIGCKSRNIQSAKSIVYLWDRDSIFNDVTETIDFGFESLEMIEELDGVLVGVSFFANTSTEAITLNPKMIFKYYGGGPTRAKQFLEIPLTSATINNGELPTINNTDGVVVIKQKINNRLLFLASVEINNARIDGLWSITRLVDDSLAVYVDRLINNDTAITSCEPKGFLKFGDYVVVSFEDNGVYKANVTINAATYTSQTAKFETIILGESYLKYKLKSIGVMTEPLPSGGTVVLSYKKDAETAWTQIFSNTTVTAGSFVVGTEYTILSVETTDFTAIGASANTVGVVFIASGVGSGTGVAARTPLFHEAINIESSGATLPSFNEIQFQIKSTGGAVIIGFWTQAEEIESGFVRRILKIIKGWIG